MVENAPKHRIRVETSADYEAISAIVGAAFGSEVEAFLVDRIRLSPEYVAEMALVAEVDDAVVGHVMVSHARLHGNNGGREIAMLSPLAVCPDHQRIGIGSHLVRAVLNVAEAYGEPIVILEGSPAYYGRLGFEHSLAYDIEIPLPSWAPAEAAQVMILESYNADDLSLKGRVVYPPAFDGLD